MMRAATTKKKQGIICLISLFFPLFVLVFSDFAGIVAVSLFYGAVKQLSFLMVIEIFYC